MKRILIFALILASAGFAQPQQTVTLGGAAPQTPTVALYSYDGSGNLTYICKSSNQPSYTFAVTPSAALNQGTLTNIVVSANVGTVTVATAHGWSVGNLVTVSGSTTAALNGNYVVQTAPSTTTFTIATSGVGNATYATAALAVSSTAPRTNANVWSIQKFTVNGSGAVTASQWATTLSSGQGASSQPIFACDSKTGYAFQ